MLLNRMWSTPPWAKIEMTQVQTNSGLSVVKTNIASQVSLLDQVVLGACPGSSSMATRYCRTNVAHISARKT
jgi:hypothetical protein